MAKGSVVVRILSQWDDKGVKAAAKDLGKAEKDFQGFANKVGKAFAFAAAAAGVFAVKVGVDAVKAAMEDQKSAALLANTLHNVVGANDAVVASVEDFILKTELATGVVDDQLRPAFATLVAVTKNVTAAQSLLQAALDASAGSGNDLDAVSAALAKAYNGNYGQLQRLFPALDKNIVKTKDFQAALKFLSDTYGGAAAAKANTFQGQLERIKVALTETKETIGYGLLPTLTALADKITKEVIPALLDWLSNNGDKIVGVFKTAIGYSVAFAQTIYDVFTFVSRNIKVFAELGAVIAAIFIGTKVAAAATAFIGVIQSIIKVMKALRAAALGAAAAEALATGGASAALGAAAFAAALVGLNVAMNKFEKDAEKNSDSLGDLKFDFKALKVSAGDYLKGLKGLDTATQSNTKNQKELTAEQQKALEVLAQLKKMGIVPTSTTDPIELEAARLNLIKQNNLAEAERIAKLQQAIIDQSNLNQATQRYADILQVLADSKISNEEVLVLAQKWGMTAGQVVEYITRIYAANSTDTNDSAIIKLYMAWGMTKQEAEKYVDFARALKDQKLDDSEIINLQHKWGLTKAEVLAYAEKVRTGTVFSTTWSDPGNAAKKSWEDALAALQAYIDKVKEATGTATPKGTTPAGSSAAADAAAKAATDAAAKAAAAADAAAKAAADAAAKAAADAAAKAAAADAAAKAAADAATKAVADAAAKAAAADAAAKAAADAAAKAAADAAAKAAADAAVASAAASAAIISGTQGAGTGSTEVPLGTVIPQAPSSLQFIPTSMLDPNLYGAGKIPVAALSTMVSKAANPAISNLAKRTGEFADIAALGQNPSAYVSSATSGTSGGATTIIVQGNLVTQADNVAAIRNDLLNNQLSGKPMTFSAVAL